MEVKPGANRFARAEALIAATRERHARIERSLGRSTRSGGRSHAAPAAEKRTLSPPVAGAAAAGDANASSLTAAKAALELSTQQLDLEFTAAEERQREADQRWTDRRRRSARTTAGRHPVIVPPQLSPVRRALLSPRSRRRALHQPWCGRCSARRACRALLLPVAILLALKVWSVLLPRGPIAAAAAATTTPLTLTSQRSSTTVTPLLELPPGLRRPNATLAAANRAHYKKMMRSQIVAYRKREVGLKREHRSALESYASQHSSRVERHARDHIMQLESIQDARRVTSQLRSFSPDNAAAVIGAHDELVQHATAEHARKAKKHARHYAAVVKKQKAQLAAVLRAHKSRFNERIELLQKAHDTESNHPTSASGETHRNGKASTAAAAHRNTAVSRDRIASFVLSAHLEHPPAATAGTAKLRALSTPVLAERSGINAAALAKLPKAQFGALAFAWTPPPAEAAAARAKGADDGGVEMVRAATAYLAARGDEEHANLRALSTDAVRNSLIVALSEYLHAPVRALQSLGGPQLIAVSDAFATYDAAAKSVGEDDEDEEEEEEEGGDDAEASGEGKAAQRAKKNVKALEKLTSQLRTSASLLRECAAFIAHHSQRQTESCVWEEALRILSKIAIMPLSQLITLGDETLERMLRMYRTIASGGGASSNSSVAVVSSAPSVFVDPTQALGLGQPALWNARDGGSPKAAAPLWVRDLYLKIPFQNEIERSPAWRRMWPPGAVRMRKGEGKLIIAAIGPRPELELYLTRLKSELRAIKAVAPRIVAAGIVPAKRPLAYANDTTLYAAYLELGSSLQAYSDPQTTALRAGAAEALRALKEGNAAFRHLRAGFERKLLMESGTGRWIVPLALAHRRAMASKPQQ